MKLINWLHHARWDVNNSEWTGMEDGAESQSISRKKVEPMEPYENESQIYP